MQRRGYPCPASEMRITKVSACRADTAFYVCERVCVTNEAESKIVVVSKADLESSWRGNVIDSVVDICQWCHQKTCICVLPIRVQLQGEHVTGLL